jgi:Tetratricopeptide repeat
LQPSDSRVASRIQLALAEACLSAGRVADAQRALDRAIELGAEGPAIQELRQRVAATQPPPR